MNDNKELDNYYAKKEKSKNKLFFYEYQSYFYIIYWPTYKEANYYSKLWNRDYTFDPQNNIWKHQFPKIILPQLSMIEPYTVFNNNEYIDISKNQIQILHLYLLNTNILL